MECGGAFYEGGEMYEMKSKDQAEALKTMLRTWAILLCDMEKKNKKKIKI